MAMLGFPDLVKLSASDGCELQQKSSEMFVSEVSRVRWVLVVRHVGFNGAPLLRACLY